MIYYHRSGNNGINPNLSKKQLIVAVIIPFLFMFVMFIFAGLIHIPGFNLKNIKCTNDMPFTISDYSSYASIDSVKILSVTDSTINSWVVEYEMIGTYEGDGRLMMKVKCYDKDNYLLESRRESIDLSSGEKFKATNEVWVPKDTVSIVFEGARN